MADKLEPCPFCGSPRVRVTGDSEVCWGVCDVCFAEGPSGQSAPAAIRLWNTRKQKDQPK